MFKNGLFNHRGTLLKPLLALILLFACPSIVFADEYYKTTTRLNIRTGPGVGYSVITTLNDNEEVAVIDKGSNWYKIKYAGQFGYVSSEFLAFSRSTSSQDNIFSKLLNKKVGIILLILCITSVVILINISKNETENVANYASAPSINKPQQTLLRNRTQCPKCSSTSLYVSKKGFSGKKALCGAILIGPLGFLCGNHKSNKIYSTCLNCNHSW